LAYSVEATNNSYTDTGLFSVYFGTEKSNIAKCRSLIFKEFDTVVNEGLSPAKLKAAKRQLLGQLAIASDNPEAQCLNMGKSLLVYGKVDSIEEIKSKIESISDSDIHEVAVDILNPSKLSTLIYR
jgi:predicted Zn-dependent peptidase